MLRAVRMLAIVLMPFLWGAGPGDDGRWNAGAYSFSDEMGGFNIRSVTGSGTRDDPFVIMEDLHSASPVTLVIRATRPLRPFGDFGRFATGFLHLRILVGNASGLAWIEFEFELQELRGQPSVYGDGLSFDQRYTESGSISSSAFAFYERDFEPYDRLLFTQGKVDPGEVAGFSFLVTDFTPRTVFYLVQDPRLPFS